MGPYPCHTGQNHCPLRWYSIRPSHCPPPPCHTVLSPPLPPVLQSGDVIPGTESHSQQRRSSVQLCSFPPTVWKLFDPLNPSFQLDLKMPRFLLLLQVVLGFWGVATNWCNFRVRGSSPPVKEIRYDSALLIPDGKSQLRLLSSSSSL